MKFRVYHAAAFAAAMVLIQPAHAEYACKHRGDLEAAAKK